jgi:hypothetical protein
MKVLLLEHVVNVDKESEAEKQRRRHSPIREVLIQKMDTHGYSFWGRTKESRWVEQLDIKWMNENKLTRKHREALIHSNKIGRLLTLPWDLSTQTPRPRGEIQTESSLSQLLNTQTPRPRGEIETGASLLQVFKIPVCCNLFMLHNIFVNQFSPVYTKKRQNGEIKKEKRTG